MYIQMERLKIYYEGKYSNLTFAILCCLTFRNNLWFLYERKVTESYGKPRAPKNYRFMMMYLVTIKMFQFD